MRQLLRQTTTPKARWKDDRGASMVEFAIVLPLLLLLVFGLIEFGLVLYNKQVITNAGREGARAGIQQASPPGVAYRTPNRYTVPDITGVVSTYCGNYLVSFGGNNHSPPVVSVPASCTSTGEILQVDVSYTYSYLVFDRIAGLFGNSSFNPLVLNSSAVMICE